VKPGKLPQLKHIESVIYERIKSEARTISYKWSYFGDRVTFVETYTGARGFLEHVGHVMDLAGQIRPLVKVQRKELYGQRKQLDMIEVPGVTDGVVRFYTDVKETELKRDEEKPTVVLTGVSGFIGSHVASLYLQHGGFNVIGTVRDR
jgi:hypothetical protein